MVGNIASVAGLLKKGLEDQGQKCILVAGSHKYIEGNPDYSIKYRYMFRKKFGKNDFDIVHLHSPNLKILLMALRYINFKHLVCHWHGSDLRIRHKSIIAEQLLKKFAGYHLYSTIDLAWWLRKIPKDKKELFICPVDTNLFKPMNIKHHGTGIFDNEHKMNIKHTDMPTIINSYDDVIVYPNMGLSAYLVSVTALECASCGKRVFHHPYMTRDWVIENASIESQTKKLIDIYNKLLKN